MFCFFMPERCGNDYKNVGNADGIVKINKVTERERSNNERITVWYNHIVQITYSDKKFFRIPHIGTLIHLKHKIVWSYLKNRLNQHF